MTEFALIVPVFMLIVVGMLVFGRLLFYWIETNHVASETARWAVVDRNPYGPARRSSRAHEAARPTSSRTTPPSASISRTRTIWAVPGSCRGEVEPGDPVRVRVQVPVSFVKFFGWGVTIKGSATMRIERIADITPPSFRRSPILARTFLIRTAEDCS